MTNKTIGILGATGTVGKEAVETILAFTGYHIVLGGRNTEKLREKYRDMEQRMEFFPVDVFDSRQLHDFCGKCDIVVNCAGPSKQIFDRVASASLEQRAHYVDVSGDEQLYRQLMERRREIDDKRLSFIISAGVYPGLSEIFPAYAAENDFDEIDSLELFFAGNGGFSINAAYDIVCSIQDETGMGMTYCKNGEATKMDRPFHRSYTLPSPAGERVTFPVLSAEFLSAAQKYKFKSALFYNTYPDKSVLNHFVMIKAMEQYKTEEQKQASAKLLSEQFGGRDGTNPYTMYHLIAAGHKNGKPVQLISNLLYNNDWNALSGIVAANAARLVMEVQENRFGCFFAAEGINVTRMMALLAKQKIVLSHTRTEGVKYERE